MESLNHHAREEDEEQEEEEEDMESLTLGSP